MLHSDKRCPVDTCLDLAEWLLMESHRFVECVLLTRWASKGAATDLLRDADCSRDVIGGQFQYPYGWSMRG